VRTSGAGRRAPPPGGGRWAPSHGTEHRTVEARQPLTFRDLLACRVVRTTSRPDAGLIEATAHRPERPYVGCFPRIPLRQLAGPRDLVQRDRRAV
jgi:hypothetical protein